MEMENTYYEILHNWSFAEKFCSEENGNYIEEYLDSLDLEFGDFKNDDQLSQDANRETSITGGTKDTANRKQNTKRLSANARERKRMSKINSGYDKLRCVLPGNKQKLSKMEAIQAAKNYIIYLHKLLEIKC